MKIVQRIISIGVLVTLTFFLISCGSGKNDASTDAITELTIASFGEDVELKRQVQMFNQNHLDYHIEIVYYLRSDQPEDDGIAKLQREIASGKGPDIINFGGQYATTDIVGQYTEDLLPYLERDGMDRYFSNIFNAFTFQGSLYALPISFTLQTFAGSRDKLSEYNNWTMQEMMECYQKQEETVVLYPGETKKDVFGTILTGNMESFIDWDTRTCDFGGKVFSDVLSFSKLFPDTLVWEEDFSVKKTFEDGKALLLPLQLENIYDICKADLIFGETTKYVGFPMYEGCGTVIKPSTTMLAISYSSEYKEVAWEFISQFLNEQYQYEREAGIPIVKGAYEEKLINAQVIEYRTNENGKKEAVSKAQVLFEGEDPIEIYSISEEQAMRLTKLIENADICATNDYQLYNILLEEAESFFDGGKSLLEVTDIIQSRASIYVKEK